MKTLIQAAIQDSICRNGETVRCEVDRGNLDNAALAAQTYIVWMSMVADEDEADTDWDDDKDGGVRVWGWDSGFAGGESSWCIVIGGAQ
jgi:hypothetical protein